MNADSAAGDSYAVGLMLRGIPLLADTPPKPGLACRKISPPMGAGGYFMEVAWGLCPWGSIKSVTLHDDVPKFKFSLLQLKLIRNWHKAHLREFEIKWRRKRKGFTLLNGLLQVIAEIAHFFSIDSLQLIGRVFLKFEAGDFTPAFPLTVLPPIPTRVQSAYPGWAGLFQDRSRSLHRVSQFLFEIPLP